MLEINNLTIEVYDRIIINNLSLVLNKKDKLAIIGEEGNGKSTLLKVIADKCDYAKVRGIINCKEYKLGYLEQSLNIEDLNKSIFDYLFKDQNDYYNKINNLYKNMKLLNLDSEILDRNKMETLSGGEKVKLGLLKILNDEPDILLLDEPTNDLDLQTLDWLEKFIIQSDKPIIYVSHDEVLLSKTANTVLHLELLKKKKEAKWTYVKTNYDEYVKTRLNMIEHTTQIAQNEKRAFKKKEDKLKQVMNKVEYEQATITRADPHGGKMLKRKMKSLKAQEKRLDNTELTEVPDYEEGINFFFEDISNPNQKEIVNLENYTLKINDKLLSHNINFNIKGNEHVVIIGNNGVGKSTLLKEIYNSINNRKDLEIGYMSQNYEDILDNYVTPISFLCETGNKDDIAKIRSYMGNMKFTSEEMIGKITDLSGGSKAKLILLKLVLNKYSVLILDEPTRNVSPLSNPIIRKVLRDYKGCIISVSHDRKYIETCDRIYELNKNGINEKNNYFM